MTTAPARHRPAAARQLPDSLRAPAIARRWVAQTFRQWGLVLTDEAAALLVELTSELVTNAIVHAAPAERGRRELAIRMSAGGGTVRVEVHDPDPALPTVREPDWVAESGRGLFLVNVQATEWGAVRDPGGRGKRVWFSVPCTGAPPEGPDEGETPMPVALPHDILGSGPNRVIALHGWFGDRTQWRRLHPYLDGDAFTYAFPEYRGYGDARDLTGDYTLTEIAGDVIALADKLGWDTFSLVGHSMGGTVMQRVMLDAPGRVRRLVGVSPVPASGVPFDEEGWALFAGAAAEPANRRAIIDFTTGNRMPSRWLDEMVAASVGNCDPAAFRAYLDAWARTDYHKEIVGNPTPALVIAGAHDPALSPDVMRQTWLEWYPNAELAVLADAGHYAVEETPLALISHIERFLG
ncbi:alpha/beta fold hydrolase [Thermomonospora cellulosilytica]|uniref:Pimeloyl-ACP methyl ester carboxylesterase n=1 Tax=Thermomonospora cellulosilytica TaxID=1411118 RepID=A0A7W3MVA5_9ACTN|nr:alpha/beta fold hydrolase [Thermomonospora cellulosilytica]MBA9002526.1 pimeloyl-ACP methyl ester carboxylesterase [Thermomonospora cellulosilytica]